MTWEARIAREAFYTPPDGGDRIRFTYENLSSSVDKRTTEFEFPLVNGTLVQDFGRSGRKMPVTAIFHGPDCDIEATAFEEALYQRGPGLLEHPVYGRIDVVPFGAVQRRDNLKTRANVSTVQVTFFEVITGFIRLPLDEQAERKPLEINNAYTGAQSDFDAGFDITTQEEAGVAAEQTRSLVEQVADTIRSVANTVDNVQQQFEAIKESILRGIDLIVGEPLAMAAQIQQLVRQPAQIANLITAKFEGYENLLSSLVGQTEEFASGLDNQAANEFFILDLHASATVTSMCESAINDTFKTAPGALDAADRILTAFDTYTEWHDANMLSLGAIDSGAGFQALQQLVVSTAGFLVLLSFDAAQERIFLTDRATSIVNLCAQLYGEIDERLDFLIETNDLTGSEIIEVPAGREILYYV